MKKKFFVKSFLALPLLATASMASCSSLKDVLQDFEDNAQDVSEVATAQETQQPINVEVGTSQENLEPENNPAPVIEPVVDPEPEPEPEPEEPPVKETVTIKWLDSDGTLLEEDEIKKGKVPHYDGITPKGEDINSGNYEFFVGWDKELGNVYEDTNFVAQYEAKESSENIFNFTLSEDGTYYEVAKLDDTLRGEIVIPAEHEGLPVKKIANNGFKPDASLPSEEMLALTKVYIPYGIEEIGEYAFANSNSLNSVYIPSTVKTIGNNAFSNSYDITDIVINDGVENIGEYAFYSVRNARNFAFPKTVKQVGKFAFSGFSNKSEYYVPEDCKLEKAGGYSFINSGIVHGNFPYLKEIDANTFANCVKLLNINLSPEIEVIPDNAFSGCESLKEFVIPDTVYTIGNHAFSGNKSLEQMIIPKKVSVLNPYVFYGCSNLKKVVCLGDIKTIGSNAFSASGLEQLVINDVTKIEEVQSSVFSSSNYGGFEILTNFDSIKDYMYRNNTSITNLVIPEHIKKIEEYAFNACPNLVSVDLKNVEIIEGNAFSNTKLTELNCSPALKSIGISAFSDCSLLTTVNFNDVIEEIGDSAFANCAALESITLPNSLTKIGRSVFAGSSIREIVIPGTISCDQTTCASMLNLETATITDGMTSVPIAMFNKCSNLTTVNLPASVETIEVSVFASCFNLKTINFAGTKEQWDSITKKTMSSGSGRGRRVTKWNGYGDTEVTGFKVICSDGQEVQY